MPRDNVTVRHDIYGLRFGRLANGDYALSAVRLAEAGMMVTEGQEGSAFSEAVRVMFEDVANDQVEFRKGLRKVFRKFYRKNPAYAPGARAFYLRIIRQYSIDQIEGVAMAEAG